jgi:hypothetical protein
MTPLKKAAFAAPPLLALTLLVLPGAAHAYVDPGSGSVIVTAILGTIGAIGYTFRKFFYRLKGVFRTKDAKPND